MKTGEGISRSGWSDKKLDYVEEDLGWLDHNYIWKIVFFCWCRHLGSSIYRGDSIKFLVTRIIIIIIKIKSLKCC